MTVKVIRCSATGPNYFRQLNTPFFANISILSQINAYRAARATFFIRQRPFVKPIAGIYNNYVAHAFIIKKRLFSLSDVPTRPHSDRQVPVFDRTRANQKGTGKGQVHRGDQKEATLWANQSHLAEYFAGMGAKFAFSTGAWRLELNFISFVLWS